MIEQVMAVVVGGLCGWWIDFFGKQTLKAYGLANGLKWTDANFIRACGIITGAYLFTKWFC